MVDRLASLRKGLSVSNTADQSLDLEAGLADDESQNLLREFNKEVDAIDNVINWANQTIATVDKYNRAKQLGEVEEKVIVIRRRLKVMAEKNRSFAREHSRRPATVRTRIVRYTKCTNDFIAVTQSLSQAQEQHRRELAVQVKRNVMNLNPGLNENSVDDAIESGEQRQLERVLSNSDTTAEMQQLEDIRARNKELQKLVIGVAQLNEIFQDMSILVSTQQELINEIEFVQEEVKDDTKHATEELTQAHAHQQSKRRKQMWCIILLVIIMLALILSITLTFVLKPRTI